MERRTDNRVNTRWAAVGREWMDRIDRMSRNQGVFVGALVGAGLTAPLFLGDVGAVVPLVGLGVGAVLVWTGTGVRPDKRVVPIPREPPPPPPGPNHLDRQTFTIGKFTVEMIHLNDNDGRFLMGSADNDKKANDHEKPQHPVQLSPFWAQTVPVTVGLWKDVMKSAPGDVSNDDNNPVNNVTWFDAVQFCNQLSERVNLPRCYDIDGQKVHWRKDRDGFRLPTEAEWEYACRAGTQTPWFFGETDETLSDYAWWDKNSNRQAQPVGTRLPNPWGLHDMLGNVWEWCWDRYGLYTADTKPAATDPVELAETSETLGSSRVLRGGAFDFDNARDLRSADRDGGNPGGRNGGVGFRCVRGVVREHAS